MSVVLDASALLALIKKEPGQDRVISHLAEGVISTVNLSEVLTWLISKGATHDMIDVFLEKLPVEIEPFSTEDAIGAARLRSQTKSKGLSLGDRACLATAQRLGAKVLTADRVWADLPAEISQAVILIR